MPNIERSPTTSCNNLHNLMLYHLNIRTHTEKKAKQYFIHGENSDNTIFWWMNCQIATSTVREHDCHSIIFIFTDLFHIVSVCNVFQITRSSKFQSFTTLWCSIGEHFFYVWEFDFSTRLHTTKQEWEICLKNVNIFLFSNSCWTPYYKKKSGRQVNHTKK